MKSIRQVAFAVALSSTLFCGATLLAQDASDATFAKKAAVGGMAEVKLGRLAQQKGSNPAVKAFGKRMETDHSKANDELKAVASKSNIMLPTELDKKNRFTYDQLSKLSGSEFDRAYARDMIADHQTDVAEFKKEASSGGNSDIKGFASKTLPTLEDHLKQAMEVQKSVGTAEISKSMQGQTSSQDKERQKRENLD